MKTFLILCEYSLDSIIVINAKTHNEAVIKYFKEVDEDILSEDGITLEQLKIVNINDDDNTMTVKVDMSLISDIVNRTYHIYELPENLKSNNQTIEEI